MLFWAFVLGLIIGGIVYTTIVMLLGNDGILKIDHSNPEKDVYRFEISDLDKLSKRKRVILKVDNKADLSQD